MEGYFNEMLEMEKRRAERSGKLFLLMLIDIQETAASSSNGILKKICSIVLDSTRDIDIKGWHKGKAVIGIIFTEIRELDKEFIKDKIFSKIYKGLCKILDLELLNSVKISFQFFPENHGKQRSGVFYSARPVKDLRGPLLSMAKPGQGQDAQSQEPSPLKQFGKSKSEMVLGAGDLLLIVLSTFLGLWISPDRPLEFSAFYLRIPILSLLIYPAALYIFDMYNLGRIFKPREALPRIVLAVLLGGALQASLLFLLPRHQFDREAIVFQIIIMCILMTAWRMLYRTSFLEPASQVGALILGAGECGRAIHPLLESPLSPYKVKGFLDDDPDMQGKAVGSAAVLGGTNRLHEIAAQIWAKTAILAISGCRSPKLLRTVLEARLQGMEVLDMPTVFEQLTGRVPVQHIEDHWFLFADGFYLLSKDYVQKLKRLMDIIVSGGMLLCTAPMMALVAIAIRLDSSGPVFYKQTRVGKGGRIFTVWKFRSMTQNAESHGAVWAVKKDPRITRIGRVIRLCRIDELPQIWNVFRGDMSLVGPRPERPEFVRELEKKIPYYFVRHSVPPGITGWAQINYPYGASVEDAQRKLEYDLYYIKNMSLFLDLKILLRTVGVVLMGEGAR
jgi:exopolysaccharide biosynthesis polyprenyl glycosylphosphotransferase